jgi:DNA-directed RNA polymerase subunit beta'
MTQSEKQFDYIKIKLASPDRIKQWGQRTLPNGQIIGEVKKAETINYRTFKPEMNGLFCERIFGPNKNLECACGKYKRVRYEGLICDRCGVEITESRVRRHRMGYINLIYPVTHIWYINSRPNYMALLLEVEQNEQRLDTGISNLPSSSRRLDLSEIRRIKKELKKLFQYGKVIPSINKKQQNKFFRSIRYKAWLKKRGWLNKTELDKLQDYIKRSLKYKDDITPSSLLTEDDSDTNINKPKPPSANDIAKYDQSVQRIKLASLAYFIAEDEADFYALHWDFKSYRTFRRLNYSGYPSKSQLRKLTTIPHSLVGSVIIRNELERLNLSEEIIKTRQFILYSSNVLAQKNPEYLTSQWFRKWEHQRIYKLRAQAIKRVRILENLSATRSNPSWMVLSVLPVIPPALRPMIQLEGGRFATSDLNELYRRVITRNNRLLRLLEIDAPQLIIRNEKRMLQEAVDTLIDNGKRGKIALGANNRPLKSLSDIIKGKQGRFRQNLLGKRVDYSGRSVIVVGPSLKLNQCGLPYEMAIELFQPFIIRELINQGLASNMKVAKNLIHQNEPLVDNVLEQVLANHPIFLNRAPTLHRLGIQAFEPILVQGRAIKLHPLVCSAFNADFDGDQMAVHIPLSLEAQAECYMLMLAPYNFLSPSSGEPIIMPSQDMVLGCYYLTVNNIKGLLGSNHYFTDLEDVLLAYNQEQIELHSSIWVRYKNDLTIPSKVIKTIKLPDQSYIEYYENLQVRKDRNDNIIVKYLQTTTGRVIFNYTIQKTLNLL